jgi:hypothetical protein
MMIFKRLRQAGIAVLIAVCLGVIVWFYFISPVP